MTIRLSEQNPNKMFMNGFKSYFRILDKDGSGAAAHSADQQTPSSGSKETRGASQQKTHSAHDEGASSGEDV